jgi:single-strand DNA-binding protein
MAVQYNYVHLCGNLGADPSYKVMDSGRYFCSFRLFVNRVFYTKDKETGEMVKNEALDTPMIHCWGKNAERMAKFLKKGRNVMIIGHIETHSWDDPNDPSKKVYTTVVMADDFKFLDRPKEAEVTAPKDTGFKVSDAEAIRDVNI